MWSGDSCRHTDQKTISFLCMSYGVTGDWSKPQAPLCLHGYDVYGTSPFKGADKRKESAERSRQTLGGFSEVTGSPRNFTRSQSGHCSEGWVLSLTCREISTVT